MVKTNKNKKIAENEESNLKGLSSKEVSIVSELEFNQRYYFKREDIAKFFKSNKELINTLYSLNKKGRVVRLSKNKYYLIPIKARIGKWTDEPFIIIDEVLESKDYFIGGWSAANHWRLTDQIPFRYDVYTTRRQGNYKILGVPIFFHRTTKKYINQMGIKETIKGHSFIILNKKDAKRWMRLRE